MARSSGKAQLGRDQFSQEKKDKIAKAKQARIAAPFFPVAIVDRSMHPLSRAFSNKTSFITPLVLQFLYKIDSLENNAELIITGCLLVCKQWFLTFEREAVIRYQVLCRAPDLQNVFVSRSGLLRKSIELNVDYTIDTIKCAQRLKQVIMGARAVQLGCASQFRSLTAGL